MRKITLIGKYGKNKFALIDDDYHREVSKYTWYVTDGGYVRMSYKTAKYKPIYLHQVIMGSYPKGLNQIDHINGNKLDNQKKNLIFCTHPQNLNNKRKYKNNKSGIKNVNWDKRAKKWRAKIYQNKKCYQIGMFTSLKKAQEAIQKAKVKKAII